MDSEPQPPSLSPRRTKGAIRDRLGLPSMSGQRSLAASLVVDSLGDGFFVPFAIVYFLKTTQLSLQTIGVGLSVAGFLALPTVILAGLLIDRLAATTVVIVANLGSAVAFAGYLTVDHAGQLVAFALLAAIGGRLYWTANLALVSDAVSAAERPRWFAFQRAVRNAGFGLGGLLGAVAVGAGGEFGYRAIAVVNAASYLAAAALVLRWSRQRSARLQVAAASLATVPVVAAAQQRNDLPQQHAAERQHRRGYRAALTDGPFMLLAATNLLFVLSMLALNVLLAVFLVRDLHEPVWLSGVLFAANTAAVACGQTTLSAAARRFRPATVLRLAAGIWAVSFLLLWLLGMAPRPAVVPGLFLAIAVFTAAEMMQGPVLNDLVVAAAPSELRGRYLATYQLSWAVGTAAAPALFSSLFSASPQLPWAALAIACGAWAAGLGWLSQVIPRPAAGPASSSPQPAARQEGSPAAASGQPLAASRAAGRAPVSAEYPRASD